MKATVLGAQGFIGQHLLRYLTEVKAEVFAPMKGDPAIFTRNLGHVFYCIGLTADFRQRPVDTIRAHVCYLIDILQRASYDSVLYLSSTRVYAGAKSASEVESLLVNPCVPGDLYNLSKLTGEAACLAFPDESIRIARLSNVYGSGMDPQNFLASLIEDAVVRRRIFLHTSRESTKDYVWVRDVAEVLPTIARSGRHRIYNIAGGRNVSTEDIVCKLKRLTGCVVDTAQDAPTTGFPMISIDRLKSEMKFEPRSLEGLLESLVNERQLAWRAHDKNR